MYVILSLGILRAQSAKLCNAFETRSIHIAEGLNAEGLIAPHVLKDLKGTQNSNFEKASNIVQEMQRQLEANDHPDSVLEKICGFLQEQDKTLQNIGAEMMDQLKKIISQPEN